MRYRNARQQIWTWVLSIAGLLVLTIALPSLSIWVVLMTGIVSLIAVLHPLPRLWLPTRKTAGCVLALSFGLLAVGGAHLPEPPPATPEEFEAQAEKRAAQAEVRIRQAKVRGEARRRTEAAKKRPAAVIQAEANAARLATQATQAHIYTITFSQVHNIFGRKGGLTELQKDREWEKYQGKCVEWTGELAYLDEGFLSGFNIGFKHARDTLTYDVLISAPQSEERRLLTWRKGQRYTYQATLKNPGGALLPISADWGCD